MTGCQASINLLKANISKKKKTKYSYNRYKKPKRKEIQYFMSFHLFF